MMDKNTPPDSDVLESDKQCILCYSGIFVFQDLETLVYLSRDFFGCFKFA